MKRRDSLLIGLVAVAAAACNRTPPPAPLPAPTAVARPPVSDPGIARLSIVERLQREAASRPGALPAVESVAAALAARGLPLVGWKQVLASPLGARFCMAGQTGKGNAVAVCEFANADEAARGLTYSRATFDRLIPNRTLTRREKTLLTVARAGSDRAQIDEANTATAIFAAL